jgi:3-phenylpropionate/trans-cinnamate dioxygenase ferredoxin component
MFVKLCGTSEVSEEGIPYRFEINDKPLVVTKLSNRYFVAGSICTHEEADLSLGILTGEILTCPLHQAKFDITTGKVLGGPNGEGPETVPPLKTYPSKVQDGDLLVDI